MALVQTKLFSISRMQFIPFVRLPPTLLFRERLFQKQTDQLIHILQLQNTLSYCIIQFQGESQIYADFQIHVISCTWELLSPFTSQSQVTPIMGLHWKHIADPFMQYHKHTPKLAKDWQYRLIFFFNSRKILSNDQESGSQCSPPRIQMPYFPGLFL